MTSYSVGQGPTARGWAGGGTNIRSRGQPGSQRWLSSWITEEYPEESAATKDANTNTDHAFIATAAFDSAISIRISR